MAAFLFEFEWDPAKARTNFRKHGVNFERAAEVFLDPLALTIPDDEHSATEVRLITIGKDYAWPICSCRSHFRATRRRDCPLSDHFSQAANPDRSLVIMRNTDKV